MSVGKVPGRFIGSLRGFFLFFFFSRRQYRLPAQSSRSFQVCTRMHCIFYDSVDIYSGHVIEYIDGIMKEIAWFVSDVSVYVPPHLR